MEPSALSFFMALSISLRSMPVAVAIWPALIGAPFSFIVASTASVTSM